MYWGSKAIIKITLTQPHDHFLAVRDIWAVMSNFLGFRAFHVISTMYINSQIAKIWACLFLLRQKNGYFEEKLSYNTFINDVTQRGIYSF